MIQNWMFLKDAEIGLAEISENVRIRAIFNIQACNQILLLPPHAIINPKQAWYGIFKTLFATLVKVTL